VTVYLAMQTGTAAALQLGAVKMIAADHPGPEDVVIVVGKFRLALGPEWRINPSPEAVARLGELGDVHQG